MRRRNQFLIVLLTLGIFIFASEPMLAQWNGNNPPAPTVNTPQGLAPGDPFYFVFVSSFDTAPDVHGNVNFQDFLLLELAFYPGPGNYGVESIACNPLISLSATQSAASVLTANAPLYLVDGTQVATSVSNFWSGTLEHPIDELGDGSVVPANTEVWTGSNADGTAAFGADGSSEALTNPNSEFGLANNADSTWMAAGAAAGTESLPIYFVSQELFVPEPTALISTAGAFAFCLMRRRARAIE